MDVNNELISKTEEFLKSKYQSSSYFREHPSAMEYRLQHSYRVANIGKVIAQKEGFDVTEMVIACLLHDVSHTGEWKSTEEWRDHGINSAKIARPFLETLGLTKERIDDMCEGIAIHVGDIVDLEGKSTAFARTVGEADNMDRFDAYRIYETLQFNKFSEMDFEAKVEKVNSTLSKLNGYLELKLGTRTAEEIWKQRLTFYITFYKKLKEQLENSNSIV